jgi:hypothetical protein
VNHNAFAFEGLQRADIDVDDEEMVLVLVLLLPLLPLLPLVVDACVAMAMLSVRVLVSTFSADMSTVSFAAPLIAPASDELEFELEFEFVFVIELVETSDLQYDAAKAQNLVLSSTACLATASR